MRRPDDGTAPGEMTQSGGSPGPILEIADLSWRPEQEWILRGVSFTVFPGEFVSVIGPNGAGKSSLVKHLNRILPVRAGRIRLLGRPLTAYSYRELARLVSYVPQAKGYVPPYRVREFLLMSRHPHLPPFSAPGRRDEAIVDGILADLHMDRFAARHLDTLSGGERQKIYIAAAMVQMTDIVCLDEPTTFLDPAHCREIYTLLRELNRQRSKTIVMVTHDVNEALDISSRILGLKGGRLIFCGTPAELLQAGTLEALYDIPFQRFESAAGGPGRVAYLPGERRS